MPRGREKRVTDAEIESAFRSADEPFLSTMEAAALIGLSQDQSRDRLEQLAGRSILRSRKAPGGNLIWWLESRIIDDPDKISRELNPMIGIRVIDEIELPGSGATLYERRRVVAYTFRFLLIHESASPAELGAVGWAAGSAGYSSGESLYRYTLATALDQSILFEKSQEVQRWRLTNLGRDFRETIDWDNITESHEISPWHEWSQAVSEWSAESVRKYLRVLHGKLNSQKGKFRNSKEDEPFHFERYQTQMSAFYIPSVMNLHVGARLDEKFWVTSEGYALSRVFVPGERSELEKIKDAVTEVEQLGNVDTRIIELTGELCLECKCERNFEHKLTSPVPLTDEFVMEYFGEIAEEVILGAAEMDRVLPDLIPDHLIERMSVPGYFE